MKRRFFTPGPRHNQVSCQSEATPAQAPTSDRGVALVITLLLLFLMSVIGLVAVLTASSDLLINGYYSNYRGSFYAADSGLNIARQAIYNQISGTFNTNYATFVTPPPTAVGTAASTAQTYVTTTYGSSTSLNAGSSANSWAESFQITSASVSLAPNSPTPGYTGTSITSYAYIYNYTITSVGSATGSEKSTITESGAFTVNVSGAPASYSESFAIYGAFITNYAACQGALVPGTMTGPMFTDGEWGFETGGSYIFTDAVGQVNNNASYYDSSGNCHQVAGSSYSGNGQTIAPNFENGFNRNQASIAQPANSYSQEWATVDGKGTGEATAQPTTANLQASMKTISGTAFPSSTPSSGVYLNYATVNGTPTIQGGGLLIEGNASIVLSTSGSAGQVYTITQNGTTTTMTVNPVANTTVLTSGTTTLTLSGVPQNASVSPAQDGTMIYVNGDISSLSGTGEGAAAIQNGSAVTVTASGDINITGDVRYATEPVTTSSNQIAGDPVDTMIPGNNNGQDLGIFTANGSIYLSSSYSDQNLWVDGSQAVIGSSCASSSCGFYVGNSCPGGHCNSAPAGTNYSSSCINTFNNVGGQIQANIFGACMNTENTYYDRRYSAVSGFAPPWFPSTTVTNTGATVTTLNMPAPQRTQWVANSGQ
jgi:Tfp pilus assembly protein PilX